MTYLFFGSQQESCWDSVWAAEWDAASGCSPLVLLLRSRAAASALGAAAQREDVLALPVVLRHQHPGGWWGGESRRRSLWSSTAGKRGTPRRLWFLARFLTLHLMMTTSSSLHAGAVVSYKVAVTFDLAAAPPLRAARRRLVGSQVGFVGILIFFYFQNQHFP